MSFGKKLIRMLAILLIVLINGNLKGLILVPLRKCETLQYLVKLLV